jgi:hypothetical protein
LEEKGAALVCKTEKAEIGDPPLYPQKLASTSPTSGGRSVGIDRSRSQATEFVLFLFLIGLKQLQNTNSFHA